MKKSILRIALVAVLHILMFELLTQLSVHWRESTEELCSVFLLVFLLAGLVWAVLPAFRQIRSARVRILCRALVVVLLFVGLYTVDYFYFWHVRPNLGLYQEPDWVTQHPGFQRQLRARIEANKWRSGEEPDANQSP